MSLRSLIFGLWVLSGSIFMSACSPPADTAIVEEPGAPPAAGDPTPAAQPTQLAPGANLPFIRAVTPSFEEVPAFHQIEFAVELEAEYANPFDARQVRLEAHMTGPDGHIWTIPGFWDADIGWRVRFAPPEAGEWNYQIQVSTPAGQSSPSNGSITAVESGHPGWLQVANWVNPHYNPRYLAHYTGVPFYGVGHCNAFDVMAYHFDIEHGFGLFSTMQEYNENMLVYWPVYSHPFFRSSYDQYTASELRMIDMVVEDAARKGIYLIFTVWNHDLLRDKTHPWGNNAWEGTNGFRRLGSIDDFFTSEESWAWQENLYRYFIARWGYSPAIGLWQTVSEIEGTNAGQHADRWHRQVNQYFASHDPYRHPITASMAGDQWWPGGYANMDVLQIHSYSMKDDPVEIGPYLAGWTRRMWSFAEKPNFIGEFGTDREGNHPEFFHNAIWAGLVSGAAATPMEWNDRGSWGRMSEAMYEQAAALAAFVADLPLSHLNLSPVEIQSRDVQIRAWALADAEMAVVWVQDVSGSGKSIVEIRADAVPRQDILIQVPGLKDGTYTIRPYNTWLGEYLPEFEAPATEGKLLIVLPEFTGDIALKIEQ
jgi:hypothetical protein